MRIYIIALLMLTVSFMQGQDLTLTLTEVQGEQNEMVEVEITADGFEDVISLQFSINWNQAVAAYDAYEMISLGDAAIGEVDASEGKLRFSWFDADGMGVTLADGAILMRLQLMAVGQIGSITNVAITGDPLEIQAYYNNNGAYEPIILSTNTGTVTIIEPIPVNVGAQTGDNACFGDQAGFIDLSLDVDEDYY